MLKHNFRDNTSHIEKNLIITVLSLTKDRAVSHELINKEAKIPSDLAQRMLKKLQNESMIYARGKFIEVNSINRLKLAVRAINLGADIGQVTGLLQWKEFEAISALTLEENGYFPVRNVRFKHSGKRMEIDIVACRKPLAICADCKHWQHGINPSKLRNIVKEQVERTKALGESLRDSAIKIRCSSWTSIRLVPAIFSLTNNSTKAVDDVPVVPILQMQDFLSQLPAYVDSFEHFSVVKHNVDGWLSHES